MKPDTPLPEVAMILPMETANSILHLHPEIQVFILEQVREVICAWEQSGLDFDPITFTAAIHPVVARIAYLTCHIYTEMQRRTE